MLGQRGLFKAKLKENEGRKCILSSSFFLHNLLDFGIPEKDEEQ